MFCQYYISILSCAMQQGFSQVLKTGLWGPHLVFQMVLKSTCEGVHVLIKLPAINLQACKCTKNGLLQACFQGF